jgi:hypothetical protein
MRKKAATKSIRRAGGYTIARLGPLDHINTGGEYAFPDPQAAVRFARNESQRHPHRFVIVRDGQGKTLFRSGGAKQAMRKKVRA